MQDYAMIDWLGLAYAGALALMLAGFAVSWIRDHVYWKRQADFIDRTGCVTVEGVKRG